METVKKCALHGFFTAAESAEECPDCLDAKPQNKIQTDNENLKPGRELDAIIAEKVMGLDVVKNSLCHPLEKEQYFNYLVFEAGADSGGTACPEYSTDIGDAWKIVEKLDLFSRYYLTRTPEGTFAGQNGNYKIMTYESDDMGSIGEMSLFTYAEAPTVPMVICLAALKSISK